ncbi:trichohyalin [Anastrepha ludens]|uniref:trichohyalin n=1 Tax=Anastrepha ludens TaxID=28586 RepID=UPI0023B09545|nr:trichohyalin [Anastrepha ludens]
MRLLIVSVVSLLAARSCAYPATVSGYPYRAELLAYSPARGEFPVVNALTSGYVSYLNPQGAEHLIGYKYTEPVKSRRITNEEYLNQLIKGSLNKDEAEITKAREEHFRLWSIQQYDQYRQETERLKMAGQEPSADLLSKIRTLETIIIAARRGANVENPLTKQVRDEHLQLWNGARLAGLQLEAGKTKQQTGVAESSVQPKIYLRFQGAELSKEAPSQIAIVGETAEQKKAREEHLRIYQEQLHRVQQLQAEAGKVSVSSAHLPKEARSEYEAKQGEQQQQQQQQEQEVKIVEHLSYLKETPEVQRAKAEHLRLWNEAKLRAQNEDFKPEIKQLQSEQFATDGQYVTKNVAYKSENYNSQDKQALKASKTENLEKQSNKYEGELKSTSAQQTNEKYQDSKLYIDSQTPTAVQDTPEVQRAKAEHLKIVEELQKKAQFIAETDTDSINGAEPAIQQPTSAQPLQLYTPIAANTQTATTKSISDAGIYQSQQQAYAAVQETAEVQRAREEHLKLVKEAHLKASQYQSQNSQIANEPKPTLYAAVAALADKSVEQFKNEEVRLRVEEAKQREAEILAEAERIKEEERLQAEELLRLQQEEQRRQEQERLEQSNENKEAVHYAEKPQLPAVEQSKETLEQLIQTQIKTGSDPSVTYDIREKEKYAANPYLLRFATTAANQIGTPVATTAYYIGAQKPGLQQQNYANPGYYYLRDTSDSYIKLDNPYFLQYFTNQQGGKATLATADAASLSSALAALNQGQKSEQPPVTSFAEKPIVPIIPIASIAPITPAGTIAPVTPLAPIAPIASSAVATMKIDYGNDPALAALEKATRDHFRAHEIALEQLRLANQKQPAQKDCY